MFAPCPRAKRPRSPSPPLPAEYVDLASPLDMLIKRRRRQASFSSDSFPMPGAYAYPNAPATEVSDQPESSTSWLSRAGVNGRRSRQWQHLNAPSSSQTNPSGNSATSAFPSTSQPPPQSNFHPNHGSSPYSVEHGRAHSQPVLPFGRQSTMSSSPIHHQAPGSSPFRASSGVTAVNGMETPVSEAPAMQEEEGWGDDELGKEWGEYASENSVLYSIHRHRATNFTTPPNPNIYPIVTPVRQNQSSYHPYTQSPNPAPYRDNPPSAWSTQFPQSSPFGGMAASDTTHIEYDDQDATDVGEDGEDSGMEVLEDWPLSSQEAETRRRYEDANRLLAELAVARRRRWGET